MKTKTLEEYVLSRIEALELENANLKKDLEKANEHIKELNNDIDHYEERLECLHTYVVEHFRVKAVEADEGSCASTNKYKITFYSGTGYNSTLLWDYYDDTDFKEFVSMFDLELPKDGE